MPGDSPSPALRPRLLADVSLWSADLANLGSEIQRVDPFADSYHLDACDAHFAPTLLFFPDLIRSIRRFTRKSFHVHLMAEKPSALIPDFLASGADRVTFHPEVGRLEVEESMKLIRDAGRSVGLALQLETPVVDAAPYLESIDSLLLLGTDLGMKGKDLAPEACARLEEAASLLGPRRRQVQLIADGGIRRHTVPELRRAGADVIVPGSLVFQSSNLAATFQWLHAL